MNAAPPFTRRLIAAWLVLFVVAAASASLAGFEFKDGDSRLYARMAHAMAEQPVSAWLSPHWPAHYYKEGLFQEHTAVFFWPMAALGVLGVPEVPAALLPNFLYLLGTLLFLAALARARHGEEAAALAPLAFLLSVAGFQYLLRANHETALGLGVAAAAWGLHEVERRPWAGAVAAAGFAWCILIKGVIGLVALPALGVWALVPGFSRRRLATLAAGLLAMLLAAWLHEVAFAAANGHSFIRAYLDIHLGYAQDQERASPVRKLRNAAYYAGVVLWWFFPWSLAWAWSAAKSARARGWRVDVALWSSVAAAVVYVAFFSMFDRRASRYVFSLYPLLAVAVAPPALRLDRLGPLWARYLPRAGGVLLWGTALLVAARVYFHLFHHMFYSWNLDHAADP
ncbi:MAG: glycosyltransferase family 39 protein [Deltaproteobacteria bacterium]|nr:glycosyltransferase family 39 protein [Deltaproteobacteria bacterium]